MWERTKGFFNKVMEKAEFLMKDFPLRYHVLIHLSTLILASLTFVELTLKIFPLAVNVIFYVGAAASLTLSVCYFVSEVQYVSRKVSNAFASINPFTNRLTNDYLFRTVLFTFPGMGLNVVFAVFNSIIGVTSRSFWYGLLAVYYLLLSVMRFAAILYTHYKRKNISEQDKARRELKIYKSCGYLLTVISFGLVAAVLVLVFQRTEKSYPGSLIYIVALYTFWKLSISVVNVTKAHKIKSPQLIALRNIGHADALVSMISLEVSMLTMFGSANDRVAKTVYAISGGFVCIAVFVLGTFMIRDTKKRAVALQKSQDQ